MEEAFVKKTISTDLFLDKISAKAIGNETMLSWITLAVLSSSPGILRAMAELFEFRLDFTKSIEVEREYPLGDGYRVDLAFL